jgi:group I intron endonuclease
MRPNFSLEILEYCEKEKVVSREQYYLDLLKPEYNILKIAGSPAGRQYLEETKAKISEALKGKNHSVGHKLKISEALKGFNHTEERKLKITLAHPNCIKIEVLDLKTNITTIYNSTNEAAKALNLPNHKIISQYISRKQQTHYKARFISKKIKGVQRWIINQVK